MCVIIGVMQKIMENYATVLIQIKKIKFTCVQKCSVNIKQMMPKISKYQQFGKICLMIKENP